MRTRAIFCTPDDFLGYTNIDLNAELKDSGTPNDANKADNFLMNAEDILLTWCDENMGTRIYGRWEDVADDKDIFDSVQKAVIHQAKWMFRNGDTSTDSGYDPQKGVIAPLDTLREITIAPMAIAVMKNSGLYSHRMQNRRRYARWHY